MTNDEEIVKLYKQEISLFEIRIQYNNIKSYLFAGVIVAMVVTVVKFYKQT